MSRLGSLEKLETFWSNCSRCQLHKTRQNVVMWRGSPGAKVFAFGEGPGKEEDEHGVPFIGRAGQVLDERIRAAGFQPEDFFIANVIGCRPDNNRDPEAHEAAACRPRLDALIRIVQPKVLLPLGAVALHRILGLSKKPAITSWLGEVYDVEIQLGAEKYACALVPSYHPSYLARSGRKDLNRAFEATLRLAIRESRK